MVWLYIAVALGLALGALATAAKKCCQETPLPADVRPSAPALEVPEAVARFARVHQEGQTFELYRKDRLDKAVYKRVPGNPEGY
ncbi:MAG: hypothetical protein ACRERE_45145 [Candidatus Entotheonellia bacterium]